MLKVLSYPVTDVTNFFTSDIHIHSLIYLSIDFVQKAAKWSERKEAVAELTKLASTKKIAPGDFAEICRTLKKVCFILLG